MKLEWRKCTVCIGDWNLYKAARSEMIGWISEGGNSFSGPHKSRNFEFPEGMTLDEQKAYVEAQVVLTR